MLVERRPACAAGRPALAIRFDSSAYWATMRSVLRSPPPPIMTGMRDSGRWDVEASLHLVAVAGERHPLAAQHRDDDLQRLLELLEAIGERAELDAEGVVLELEPPGTDAQLGAAAGHDVERRDRLRQHRRVAVGVARDECPEAHRLDVSRASADSSE